MPDCIKIFLLILILQTGPGARGQQFNFDIYNRGNGLVSNEVNYISQSKEGYMLFGTPSGLSIYDGSFFINYDIAKGFHHNIISDIKELPDSELILFTNSNQYYRLSHKKLITDSFVLNDGLKHLHVTNQDKWLVSGYNGVYEWTKNHLNKLPVRKGTAYPGINCVVQWQDSLLIVGRSYEPVEVYNMRTWQLLASSAEKLFVRDFFRDRAGNIWIATIGNGMMMINSAAITGSKIHFANLPPSFNPFSRTEFRSVVQDKEQNLWMAGINNGLIKYNPTTGEFVHFTMEQGLASNTLYALFCDREDNIWTGSNRGVQKLAHKNVFSYASAQGLPADLVLDVLPVKNKAVLTSGYSGMSLVAYNAAKAKAWQPPLQDEYIFKLLQQNDKYYGLSLRKLLELSVAVNGIAASKTIDLPEHFRSIVALQKDKLLLGGDSSILLFYKGKNSVLTKEGVHHVVAMAVDTAGYLWTGGLNNSINCYRLSSSGQHISVKLAESYTIPVSGPEDFVQSMVVGKNNMVIYGTSRTGIFILEKTKGRIVKKTSINVSSGLSSNNINALSWYTDSVLLVCTGAGLDKIIFSPHEETFFVHNINVYYNITNSVYSVKNDSAGNFLLATESGFFSIPSVNIETEMARQLPVVISAVHLINNPDSVINIRQPVILSYNNSNLSISFSSPSFSNEKNIRFTYLLQGRYENKWSPPSAAGIVTFSNLPGGNYSFIVRPVNMYGTAGTSYATFGIVVVPAFWQTGWFYILIILLLSAAGFFIFRRRIQHIRRESVFKSKIAETEMMELRAQMNPHFIFNCMNIIDGLITGNRNAEARDFLQKFSKVIRLVLENSQYQLVTLQKDLQALKLYTELEAIRFNQHFSCVFDVDADLIDENYRVPPLLLQPYVENAIVHGLRNREQPGGQLLVIIKKTEEGILAIVEDNGIGRKQAAALNMDNENPHQQIGMRVTGKRIELLQQVNQARLEINIADADPAGETGTRVTIKLPQDIKFE